MMRKLLTTTAISALMMGIAHAQTAQPQTGAQQTQEQQAGQQDQAQQQITVRDGETVIIQTDGQDAQIDLRLQLGAAGQQQGAAGAQTQPDQAGDANQQQAQDGQVGQQVEGGQAPEQQATIQSRQDLQQADMQQISADNMIGTGVYSAADEHVGDVQDVLLTEDGDVDAIVVDVGGFLGMGGRHVALGMEDLHFMSDGQDAVYVYTDYTREQLEGSQEYDQATWQDDRDQQRMTSQTAQTTGGAATQQGSQQASVQQDQGGQMQGGQHVVQNGGTVIVEAQSERFQLNFELRQDGETMGAAGNDQQTTAAIDRGQMQSAQMNQVRADDLIGSTVYGANDENIGNVGDVLLNADGGIDAVIVDVGGFLGLGAREVALGMDDVEFMHDEGDNWYIYTAYTQEQLEAAPEYDEGTYADQRDQQRVGAGQ
jgi:sporulation protein YlmC with PRC-barrel domain